MDLVYLIETTILLDLNSEKEVIPIFQELYGIRKKLGEEADPKLESIQNQLRDLTSSARSPLAKQSTRMLDDCLIK
ncbi:MAG: hypothetical protein Q6362_012550 [Candidatus Wukongarchaeota archaeon]|nr:hypothetical protein [Candidatus Wukongarchaeota archaeon]MDO8130239.1 hypothetical protein [Candidatus Wukongarchaeota archaeon]